MWLDVDDDKYTIINDDSATSAASWPPAMHTITPIGWLCPRCGKINSPDVKQCDCKPEHLPNTVIGPSEMK